MKTKLIAIGILASAIAATSVSPAAARGRWFHHHWRGPVFGLFAAGAAVVGGVATVVTAPVVALADAASEPRYERRRPYDDADDDYRWRRRRDADWQGYDRRRRYESDYPAYADDRRGGDDYGAREGYEPREPQYRKPRYYGDERQDDDDRDSGD